MSFDDELYRQFVRGHFVDVLIDIALWIYDYRFAIRADQIRSMSQTIEIELFEEHKSSCWERGHLVRKASKARSGSSAPAFPVIGRSLSFRQFIKLARWFQGPEHPVGPARLVGRILIRGPRHCQPLPIDRARLFRIDVNVAIAVRAFCLASAHALMPAVHAGNWIGVDREGQVLMHADIAPPNAQAVRIARFVRSRSAFTLHAPRVALVVESDRRG